MLIWFYQKILRLCFDIVRVYFCYYILFVFKDPTITFSEILCFFYSSFPGNDSKYSVTIVAEDVKVTCSAGNHNHGSSKVKLTNVVDYNWEHKYYTGHLLAVHIAGKFFAYGIKGNNQYTDSLHFSLKLSS